MLILDKRLSKGKTKFLEYDRKEEKYADGKNGRAV